MMMEVCIDSVQSAINAEKGGATRVELCGNLMEGGTTPSLGVFKLIKEKTSIPVFVMIRPRGGDFLYSDVEFEVMEKEIQIFHENDADGFVFGILNSDGSVDKERNKKLLELCQPKPVTFHRAFDVVNNAIEAAEDIIGLGFQRILTSGLESTALEGLPKLEMLIKIFGERIIIVPGGGITEKNIERIVERCHCVEFHASARTSIPSAMSFVRGNIHMGGALYPAENVVKISDSKRVQDLLNYFKIFK